MVTDIKEYLLGGESIFSEKQIAYIRKPTPKNVVDKIKMAGKSFDYIPAFIAIDDLNRVTGYANSIDVKSFEVVENTVVCHLTITIFDKYSRDGVGGADFKRFKEGSAKAGQIVSVANSYKAAYSNAITNAMSKWGFYRDIYNKDFAGEIIVDGERLTNEVKEALEVSGLNPERLADAEKVLSSGDLSKIHKAKTYLESIKNQV